MVSVKQLEGEFPFAKSNVSSEQSKCQQTPLRGVKTHLYMFGSTANSNCAIREEQSLLDAFLLSQWEYLSCKGQLAYDVTMCETKIIRGEKEFIAQLNENWKAPFLVEFEDNTLQPYKHPKPKNMKLVRENLLFCVTSGEKESSEIIPLTALPAVGTLVMLNVNPVEYGHIFLVPYDISQGPKFLDKEVLYLILQFAREINNCSFRIFFDHNASANQDPLHFQAGYFANPLPVELLPMVPADGCVGKEGVNILEAADYPLKALVFASQDLELLAGFVAEVCTIMQQDDVVFNLLVSDCATKVFLFPQVHLLASGSQLSTWECGGYFVHTSRSEFDNASEEELIKRLAAVSLDDRAFQALKELCCSIAMKLLPCVQHG